jgi:protease-4
MNRKSLVFVLVFGAVASIALFLAIAYVAFLAAEGGDMALGDAVAVVEIRGEIYYDLSKIQEIEAHRDDDNVKAMLVFIESPGGGVTASQALYDAVRSVRRKKPVVAFLASVAASGGYYVACAADSIVAHPGTLTGSIGVIATFLRTQELFRKIGLDVTVIKTGEFKDIGSPYRPMTDEERAYLGALLDDVYRQFLGAVSEGRGMPIERVAELAEGRLFTGAQAAGLGLVDRLGTYEEALDMAASLAGITGEPRVVQKRKRRSLAERIIGEEVSLKGLASGERVRLEYLIP